jgi:hypothetical protein
MLVLLARQSRLTSRRAWCDGCLGAWVQVVVVALRVNVNLKAITLEELEGRRKVSRPHISA